MRKPELLMPVVLCGVLLAGCGGANPEKGEGSSDFLVPTDEWVEAKGISMNAVDDMVKIAGILGCNGVELVIEQNQQDEIKFDTHKYSTPVVNLFSLMADEINFVAQYDDDSERIKEEFQYVKELFMNTVDNIGDDPGNCTLASPDIKKFLGSSYGVNLGPTL